MQEKEEGRKEARRRKEGGRRKGKRKEEFMRVQTKTCTMHPLRMRRTHMARGNMGASEIVVSGTKNGNANAIVHKPHTTEYV